MKPKKSSSIEPRHIILTALALFVLGVIILIAPKQPSDSGNTRTMYAAPVTTNEAPSPLTNAVPYTEAEMHQFWDKHLRQLIQVQWLNRTLPYPEINNRMETITKSILSTTGTNLALVLQPAYHPLSEGILGQAGIETNNPNGTAQMQIVLFVPAIIDYYRDARNRFGTTDVLFPLCILTVVMHECEHAYKLTDTADRINITEESRAWLETCKYTIAPLVEEHNIQVFGAEASFYKAWLADGRQPGQAWKDYLYRHYGPLAVIRLRELENERSVREK